MANYQFHWFENGSAEYTEVRPTPRSHADPTADAAIGAVMREEKQKRRRQSRNGRSTEKAAEGLPSGTSKKKYNTRVWRADEEADGDA